MLFQFEMSDPLPYKPTFCQGWPECYRSVIQMECRLLRPSMLRTPAAMMIAGSFDSIASHICRSTSHYSLHSSHSTLHTALFAIQTSLHTALLGLHTWHFTLQTSQSTLHTSLFKLHSSRPTLLTALLTLHTPHFISSELFSP